MKDCIKIVIDTKGSDNGSGEIIKGIAKALEKNDRLAFLLVGDEAAIHDECVNNNISFDRVEILNAADEITNYDNPAEAVFGKPESSMMKAMATLAERDDLFGMITAGNTGALIAGTIRYLPRKDRVRPVLAAVLPAASGGFTCLVDTGATVDCTPSNLVHFAHLGSEFMRDMYGITVPRVGLLSNGAEETKGNKLVKEAHVLLKQDSEINFVGNIEGNKALSGDCDVLVCDGFAGNQVLKVTEGTATRIITDIVKYAKRTQSREIMELVGSLMSVYDISSLGGGVILGCAKPVIKARGSSGADTFVNTSQMLFNMAENRSIFDSEKNKI